jgi:hypothetical protein
MGRLQTLYQRYCVLTDWNIGSATVPPDALDRLVNSGELPPVRWCPRSLRLRSRADPFFWPMEGDERVIYEEIDHWNKLGHIRSVPAQGLLRRQKSRIEILQPFHLSYPFITQLDGIWYCMPEAARSGGLDLYRWDPAARAFKLERRLLDQVGILDATLHRQDGIWYLFGTMRGQGSYDTLRIWWSRSLHEGWQPHARDPVKVDVRSARSAGPLFEHRGRWYRPAQDCTDGYGGAVTINRLERLSPTEFEESIVTQVRPDPHGPYPHGLHTLVVQSGKVLIDGKRVGFSSRLLLMKLARRIVRTLAPSRAAQSTSMSVSSQP